MKNKKNNFEYKLTEEEISLIKKMLMKGNDLQREISNLKTIQDLITDKLKQVKEHSNNLLNLYKNNTNNLKDLILILLKNTKDTNDKNVEEKEKKEVKCLLDKNLANISIKDNKLMIELLNNS